MDKPAQWALVGAAWFLALSVAGFGYLGWRYLNRPTEAVIAMEAAAGVEGALPVGATAICPVTHETVTIGPQTPSLVYLERTYYFSTTLDTAGVEPKRRFLLDPESFVHPGQAPPLDSIVPPGRSATAKP